jgi:peptidoglycan/LPS O-acetylase OafA/YrhL
MTSVMRRSIVGWNKPFPRPLRSQPVTIDAAKPKHRYVALDSLRGVCACMVVLLHFGTQGSISASPLVQNAFLFVDFFFVLSGFVIGSSYGTRLTDGFSIRQFMWLRLGRVYPLHVVMLVAFLLFEIFFATVLPGYATRAPFEGSFSPATLLQSLLLVQIFFGPDATPWNGPSWSIAVEVWTYLIFALLLRHGSRWLVPVCLLVALAAPVYLANLTDRNLNVFHDGAMVRCLFGFSLGTIGWRCAAWAQSIRIGKMADHLIEIAVVLLTVALVSQAGSSPLSLAAPFLFLVAVLIFSREGGVVSGLLKTAPLILVGTLSYSIYMIHGFVLYRFINLLGVLEKITGYDVVHSADGHNSVGGSALFGDAITLVFLGLVIALSYLSYRLIELPGQRFARARVKRSGSTEPGAP